MEYKDWNVILLNFWYNLVGIHFSMRLVTVKLCFLVSHGSVAANWWLIFTFNHVVTRREGMYMTGDILFTSQTNRVNVTFSSDESVTHRGFTLDVRSIICSERDREFSIEFNRSRIKVVTKTCTNHAYSRDCAPTRKYIWVESLFIVWYQC